MNTRRLTSGHLEAETESQSLSENKSPSPSLKVTSHQHLNICILTGGEEFGELVLSEILTVGMLKEFLKLHKVCFLPLKRRELAADPLLSRRGHPFPCSVTSSHISQVTVVRGQWQLEEGAPLQPWVPLHKISHRQPDLEQW